MNEIEEKITGYGYDGEGVCRHDNKVCFIKYVLKDEIVRFEIIKDNSSFSIGKVLSVVKTSERRIIPPCPYFGVCGGCAYQHTDYQNELAIKKELLKEQFAKISFKGDIEVVSSKEPYNYRNKIKIFVGDNKIGLKKYNSNQICDIEKCMLVKPIINDAIEKIRLFISSKKLFDIIDNIVIRQEGEQGLINFFLKKDREINYQGLYLMLGASFGIFQTFKRQTKHIMGLKTLNINEMGIDCKLGVNSFHQVNNEIATKLYSKVLENTIGDIIVNCYSGAGLLSGLLSKKFKRVIAIELGDKEHEEAEQMKDDNGIFNLVNLKGDCAEVLPRIDEKIDTIIVDPPRAGIDKSVANSINKVNCARLIYVSCNSATLIRDIQRLDSFECKKVYLFDMFSRTGEYETLAILDRKKGN